MDELGNDMDSTASRLDVVQVHSLLCLDFILPSVLCKLNVQSWGLINLF